MRERERERECEKERECERERAIEPTNWTEIDGVRLGIVVVVPSALLTCLSCGRVKLPECVWCLPCGGALRALLLSKIPRVVVYLSSGLREVFS